MPPRTLLAILFALALVHSVKAQKVENAMHVTLGYINADGHIENSSHSTVGYFTKNGSGWTFGFSPRTAIASISTDGKDGYAFEYTSGVIKGYMHRKGDTWVVSDAKRVVEGYIGKNGKVEGTTRRTMGYAQDIPPVWSAVPFFFLKLW